MDDEERQSRLQADQRFLSIKVEIGMAFIIIGDGIKSNSLEIYPTERA